MRVDAFSVMIFRLSTTPGTISCSSPAYRSSVFSRTIIRLTFSIRLVTPARFRTGRRFAYKSSALRRATLTLVKPSAMGVVTGPFSATLLRLTESSSSTGSDWPWRLNAITPASCGSHSIGTPATLKIRTTAAVTSGPMPSPGISVTTCGMRLRPLFRQSLRQERGDRFEERAVVRAECGAAVAVDVDLTEHVAVAQDGHDDLGLRFEAARQVSRIRVHVVHDDRRLFGRRGPADAAAERNARVRRGFADERAEHQLAPFQQIHADPGVVGHIVF